MTRFRENPKKPHFWTILGPNWPKKILFLENRAPSHSRVHRITPLCKKSEKTNDSISRKPHNTQTHEHTHTQTHRGQFIGPWSKK